MATSPRAPWLNRPVRGRLVQIRRQPLRAVPRLAHALTPSASRFIAVAPAILLVAAGCVDNTGPDGSLEDDASRPVFDDGTGAIRGVVTDDSLAPIAGALLVIVETGHTAFSGERGEYQFSSLPPGTVTVSAEAAGFKAAAKQVEVLAGQVVSVQMLLPPAASSDPYHVTQSKSGRILCGAAWRTAPRTNGTRFAACGAGSLVGNPIEVDNYITPFAMSTDNVSTVQSLVFETIWTATQAFGNGLRIEWQGFVDLVGPTSEEPLRNFVVVMGSSPLRVLLDDHEIAKNVTEKEPRLKYCQAGGPCRFWAQNWAYPSTLGPSSQVDVSFYVDQPFTHYITEFYGDYAPRDFSALADA